ncbi:AAA family ATPase [Pediococcus acidilactici]|uniref:AAA family ATPase n=1 Tax=Pediococcus acidilactici TaxID=1254 RepID=UPI0013238EE5|nr:ATP-binding protein [Pediococcus acidilactici]KAF0385589.1 AAA family ATPase [Pediococcus acidilactici]KAF0427057.1 AAA family ATPase [Pediococcus acidilactici]KAF0442331.1 AAA family ATPase [Pediococcus acidilactici]KAF0552089.1 AAA family ATPase [Pediococcus acidilactici]MCT3041080.1 ATP-binding protein [Pediococcus acidilactici]
MLSSVKISNFYSINEPITLHLDFPINRAERLHDNTIYTYHNIEGRKRVILNGAFIYGSNASGKSNLLKGFQFIHDLIASNQEFKTASSSQSSINIYPFLLSEKKIDPTANFEVNFIIPFKFKGKLRSSKVKYVLQYDVRSNIVLSERLSYQKVQKTNLSAQINLFKRDSSEINFEESSKEIENILKKISQENIKFNSLFFYLLNDINAEFYKTEIDSYEYALIAQVYNEIADGFSLVKNREGESDEFIKKIQKDSKFKERILETLNDFDFPISNFKIHDLTGEFLSTLAAKEDDFTSDEDGEGLVNRTKLVDMLKKQKFLVVETLHKAGTKEEYFPLKVESSGTKRFIGESLKLSNALLNNHLFIKDEFDSKYHLKIQEAILEKFKPENNNEFSQFIITTQNPLLLNPKNWAMEQINFVEKSRKKQESNMYSLSDFKGITYNNHSWINLYLEGRFGAIPEVFF